jgi:predicted dehydrogenase
VKDCEGMIAAGKEAKKKLMIAYRLRYETHNPKAIEIVRSGELETVKAITAEAGFPIGDPKQWRLNKQLAGGGSLMDIGIYALNATRYLSGEEPTEVTAVIYSTPGDPRFKEVEETVLFDMKFPSGLVATCASSYGYGCNRYRVIATKGWVEAEPFLSYGGLSLFRSARGGREKVDLPQVDHFAAEIDHMAECVTSNKEPLTPGEEGLKDLKVIEAIYAAAKEGKVVKV